MSGAGDTVLSVVGLGLCAGLPGPTCIRLASHAAAVVVRKLGTATLTVDMIQPRISISNQKRRFILLHEVANRRLGGGNSLFRLLTPLCEGLVHVLVHAPTALV